MHQPTLASTLAQQVSEAFVKAGLTQDDVLVGAIKHTNLPWQIPPLVVEATLFGVPFSDYVMQHLNVNRSALLTLWADALAGMQNTPDKVVTFDGYRSASYALPGVKTPERQLFLSTPAGFPKAVESLAAVTLSLEAAHLLRAHSKVVNFVSDDDNYFADLGDGALVGIKDGLPSICEDLWDLPVNGMVQELLRTPRGAVWEGCDYDIISKVRSVLWEVPKAFDDFEAVDWALQALRVVGGQREMLRAIRNLRKTAYNRQMRLKALSEALETVNRLSLSDRQRIEMLKNLLVPEVLSSGQFSKKIYPFYTVPPAMLTDKVLDRVRQAVSDLYETEVNLYGNTGVSK